MTAYIRKLAKIFTPRGLYAGRHGADAVQTAVAGVWRAVTEACADDSCMSASCYSYTHRIGINC